MQASLDPNEHLDWPLDLGMRERLDARCKADVPQSAEPFRSREQPFDVAIVQSTAPSAERNA